jgi:integrase
MATIQHRVSKLTGKTTYRVQIVRPGFAPIYQSFKKLTAAKAFAAGEETKINEGGGNTASNASKRTLSDAIKRYAEAVLVNRDDQSTKRHYAFWTERLGHVRLRNVTPDMILAARDDLLKTKSRLGKPLAPATCKLYLESLSAVFKYCRKELRWTKYNPCADVTRPKLPKGRVRFLSDAERAALLDACKASTDPRLYSFVLLAISTGARAGELTGLTWGDVDLERGTASLRKTKNGEMRAMPIKGAALAAIKAMHSEDTDPATHVFAGPPGPIFDYQDLFTRARDAAGIKDFRFHDCRHCTGSYLAMNGASASEIAAVLGHKTLVMVKRYSHLSDGHVGSVIERMNEKVFGAAAAPEQR